MSKPRNLKPLVEQIEEMKGKLKLLDGDTKAYYEASYRYLHEAKEKVYVLRSEVQELRKDYLEHTNNSDFIMDQAFQKAKENYAKMANRPTSLVLAEMDYDVSTRLNQLNALRHQTKVKSEKADKIESDVNDVQGRIDDSVTCSNSEYKIIQGIRNLENKLDKASMKSDETVHIGQTYRQIHDKLLEEQCTYATTVEALEIEILRCSSKLDEMKTVCKDACELRDQAKEELKRHEEVMYAHRKRRELELVNMRRTLEMRKDQTVATKTLIIDDDIGKSEQEGPPETSDDSSATGSKITLSNLEKVYHELKVVTGIADLELMKTRFSDLEESTNRLNLLRVDAENKLLSCMEQKKRLKLAFLDLRSIADAKFSENSAHTVSNQELKDSQRQIIAINKEFIRLNQIISYGRMIVEHIFLKLNMLKSRNKRARKQSLYMLRHITDMNIIDLLKQCIAKQDSLANDLEEYNTEEQTLEMNRQQNNTLMSTDDHFKSLEKKIPLDNLRIVPYWTDPPRTIEEEDPDHADWKSRIEMQNSSAYIISVNKRAKTRR